MTSSNASPELLSSASSSNSSSLPSQWSYDVFLSFRGEDTRNNFTGHLYNALRQKGINTYMDNEELRRGEEISPALLKAIEESKISIIVFSENYASSTWCLDELMKILECKESKQQKVLPVFYKVEPSTVRHQKNSFEEALAKHKDRFKDDHVKVQSWKTALNQATQISGLHLKINENKSKFIEKIVQEVSKIVPSHTYLHVAEYPVGINSRVEDIYNMLLCIKENEKCMIGIFGVGGIGKTTIAKEMYNRITNQFEGSCFLANVRENSKPDKGGFVKLQKKILSNILRDPKVEVDDVDGGINLIMERLCCKKVLLVLDDIDCLDQLKKLCGRCDWFGSGSRIIITTRDEGLLNKHHVHFKYRMKEMDHDEALKLFSWHAFESDKPDNGFEQFTKLALQYAGGLPLALQVIGSNLSGRDILFWKSELEKYNGIPEKDIQEKLKISFDGLDDCEKNIFLDIACFFKGDEREYVTKILDSCGFHAYSGITRLNEKCLITIDQYDGSQYLRMHDLLQDMGREIVRQESPKEPGKRSRLYFHKDVRAVLEENKGTEQIEGILIDLPREDHKTQMSTKTFAKLKNLRIFINRNASFSGRLKYFSNELRVLDWLECPLEFLPSTLHGKKLIVLKMQGSMFRELGTRVIYENLTSIDFSESKYLTKISDLSSCSNLEKLILNDCESLVEVHDSVGFLDKLVQLSFFYCSSLKKLPRSFKLRSLELLELRGCTSLEYFPEIECEMEYLKYLCLESKVIQELPSSITYLIGLEQFVLRRCESLVYLPINIFQLKRLMVVHIQDCPNFANFGKEVGQNGQSMPLPESNIRLCTLILSRSGIVSLSPWIEGLVGLSHLDLAGCQQLKEILQLPLSIEVVNAPRCERLVKVHDSVGCLDKLVELRLEGCSSLKNLPRSFELRSLKVLELEGCTSLEYFPEIKCEMEHLKCVRLHSIVIQELPSSFTYLTGLEELYLSGCKSLVRLPLNIFESKSLWAVNIINCPNLVNFGKEVGQNGQSMPCTQKNEISSSKELFPWPPPKSNNLSRTYNFSFSLRKLSLSGSGIVSLPPCIKAFLGLSHLDLTYCEQLEEILHLPPNIEEVEAFGCGLLKRFHHVSTECSFGIPNLKRLTWIDLSECNKVEVDVGNHAPDPLLVQERFQEKESSMIIYRGSRIPKWFKYCKETTSNSIEIEFYDRNAFKHQIVALVLCFVPVAFSSITISINDQRLRNDIRLRPSMDRHRVCLQYIAGNYLDQMLSRSYSEGNNMRFAFGSDLKEAIFESAGVHLIYIDPIQKMLNWKNALEKVADFSGFPLVNFRNESECIEKIVQDVSSKLPNRTCLHVAKYPVGLESRVEDINMLLRIEIINETRMIGIFGTGGIGKTTITKEVYNRIADQFEGSCFLANVRESSKQDLGDLVELQKKILSDILSDPKVKVNAQGINLRQEKLRCKKVLLVLDDIDCLDQLKILSGRCDWFGLGSRIIITTRDEHLLDKHHVQFKYRTKEMDHDEALQLFSQHAFKSDKPDDAFADVIKLALKCAGGLPLTLQVMSSNLYGEDIRFWKSKLEKYKSIQEENIHKKLKISYDGLDDRTKKIFLDIACFFKGDEREYVTKILDSCGFFACAGIKKLNDKCLITIDEHDRLMMHDLLQDMGREIVRQESPEEPNKRSRLYFSKDVSEVLGKNKGTKQIEGILTNQLAFISHSKVFAKMKRLRILIIRDASVLFDGLNYLSNELRVLDWYEYSPNFLPSSFHGEKLIVLNLRRSSIIDLGTGLQSKNLISIDLSDSHDLTNISDLSSCSNLEKLILGRCGSLVEVHDSVGFLNKLVELDFTNCSSLKKLPRSFKLRSLKLLELEGCTSLEYLPEIECEMGHLKFLTLESIVIQELPSSITYLIGLEVLYMRGCKSLVHLPINIFKLERLKVVFVIKCPNFVNFGNEVGHNGQSMTCTQENEISSSMELLPLPPPELSNLSRTYNFSSSLRILNLSGSGIVSLPPCIEGFVGLSELNLTFCKQLEEILHLPPNIEEVDASGCSSLKNFLPESNNLSRTYNFSSSLRTLNLSGSGIVSLPPCIEGFVGLSELHLRDCKQLEEILHLPPNIKMVDARGCNKFKDANDDLINEDLDLELQLGN